MTENHVESATRNPRLEGLSVAVVGAGRIGSEVIRNLASMGVGRIEVFESDPRTAAPLRDRHVVHEGDFWDELTLGRLGGFDFAVCTVQDHAARVRMNQKCLVAGVSLVHVWTDEGHALAAAYPFGFPGDCGCYECGEDRTARPTPLAALRLTHEEPGAGAPVTAASIAGAVGAALIARISMGFHGATARRVTLDTATGDGTSFEWRRDPSCPRCRGVVRPVPIVHTRNRWAVSSFVEQACPESLEQSVLLSDDIEDTNSFRVRDLAERFQGGPIPAKFALTVVDGRTVCLDFEDLRPDGQPSPAARAVGGRRPRR